MNFSINRACTRRNAESTMRLMVILLVLGLASGGAVAAERLVPLDELTPNSAHKRATRIVLDLMRRYHYRKVTIDNQLSERMWDRYVETLDPNRAFFLQSDIDEFRSYRHTFDEALRFARLTPGFEMFKRLRARVTARTKEAVALLDHSFDFNRAETYRFNRTKAPWAKTDAELSEIWRKRVKNDILELRLSERPPDKIKETLTKRYERMNRSVSQRNANDVYQLFINAYTVSIEPHTAYFSPRTSENFKIRMSLSLEGIGAALQTENEYTVVRRIIKGGPADLSKQLRVNDRIVGVGQGDDEPIVDVISWRLEDVVDLIRGPKSSVVRLQILPGKAVPGEPPTTISLVRDKINLEERAAKRSIIEVPNGRETVKVGVINVPTFYLDSRARARGVPNYRSTTRDVRRLVSELMDENVAGIVVDLRGNSGGSLVEATELTGLFIKSGPVVQIRDSRGRMQVNKDPDPSIAYRGPLAVLVDRRSASASEIFSAAIQDYQRGIILGEPTYGKGTVQNLFDLDQRGGLGQLKVTIAQFFRINGEGTQHRGVVPDIVFPTAIDSKSHGERALDNALPWASIGPARYKPVVSVVDFSHARKLHEDRIPENAHLQVLLDELEAQRRVQGLESITLEESERKREWETRRAERDAREIRLRKALGLPASPTSSAEKATAETQGGTTAKADEDDALRRDVILEEAARILLDVIKDTPKQVIAQNASASLWTPSLAAAH